MFYGTRLHIKLNLCVPFQIKKIAFNLNDIVVNINDIRKSSQVLFDWSQSIQRIKSIIFSRSKQHNCTWYTIQSNSMPGDSFQSTMTLFLKYIHLFAFRFNFTNVEYFSVCVHDHRFFFDIYPILSVELIVNV